MRHMYVASIRLNGMHRMQSDQQCFDHLSVKEVMLTLIPIV